MLPAALSPTARFLPSRVTPTPWPGPPRVVGRQGTCSAVTGGRVPSDGAFLGLAWCGRWRTDASRNTSKPRQADVRPGFTVHGMDIGKGLDRQPKPEVREALADGQRESLEHLGVVPLAAEPEEPASRPRRPGAPASGTLQRWRRGGAGQHGRKLRFRTEAALARRLGSDGQGASVARSGGSRRCDGWCRLVGCRHDRDPEPDAPQRV